MSAIRRYTLDAEFFTSIDCELKAYWLGYFYADGHVSTKWHYVTVTSKDIEHIDKWRNAVCTDQPIGKSSCGRYGTLSISSKQLHSDLIAAGCMQRKTHKLTLPQIRADLVRHFLRGYFDGDGCLTGSFRSAYKRQLIKKWKWSLISTRAFCTSVQALLVDVLGVSSRVDHGKRQKDAGNEICSLNVSGIDNIGKILAYLYEGSTIYLDRKFARYGEFLEDVKRRSALVSVRRLFSEEQVAAFRAAYEAGGITHQQLSDRAGCCKDTMKKLLQRKQYK